MSDAGLILLKLHGVLLRHLCDQAGRHFEGLSSASRYLFKEGHLDAKLKKKLCQLDYATALVRHVTNASATSFEQSLLAQFAQRKQQGQQPLENNLQDKELKLRDQRDYQLKTLDQQLFQPAQSNQSEQHDRHFKKHDQQFNERDKLEKHTQHEAHDRKFSDSQRDQLSGQPDQPFSGNNQHDQHTLPPEPDGQQTSQFDKLGHPQLQLPCATAEPSVVIGAIDALAAGSQLARGTIVEAIDLRPVVLTGPTGTKYTTASAQVKVRQLADPARQRRLLFVDAADRPTQNYLGPIFGRIADKGRQFRVVSTG